jgi:metal-responsive CopG/Arc/MetJ family transcriptional regulator
MKKILISFPDNFLEEIDNQAKQETMTRSEFIRHLWRTYKKHNTTTCEPQ